MVIRPLTAGDAPAYLAIRREMLADAPWAFSSSPDVDRFLDPASCAQRLAEPGQAIIGAFEEDGELVGVAGVRMQQSSKLAHRALVWGVYVRPSHRSGGVGARVVARAIETAGSWPSVDSIGLAASERAESARRMYERLGFRAWGREPAAVKVDGRAYDEIHMVLFLAKA